MYRQSGCRGEQLQGWSRDVMGGVWSSEASRDGMDGRGR
jgi:hypothetical protein